MTSYPVVDAALAMEVLGAIGCRASDGVEVVVDGFRSWLPMGSVAKWSAVDRGEIPPGADPRTALDARLDGDLSSWSCWAVCSSVGGVLAACGHDVAIAVEQMRGPGAPVVDFHSVLVVDGALVDPFLGPSAPIPLGHDVTRPDGWGAWVPGERPEHLGARGGGGLFRYRLVAARLDPVEVRAFCQVSASYTGVGRRRTAHWLRDGALWFLREQDDGLADLRRTAGPSPWELTRTVVARGRYEEVLADHFG